MAANSLSMIKRKLMLGNSYSNSYDVSPNQRKTKPRRMSLTRNIIQSFKPTKEKKITRCYSSNALNNVCVHEETKIKSCNKCKNKNTKCKHNKEKKIQRLSPRRSSVPSNYRHKIVNTNLSRTAAYQSRRYSVSNILSHDKHVNRNTQFCHAKRFHSVTEDNLEYDVESGISSASSSESVISKLSKATSNSCSSDESNNRTKESWGDSVLTPASLSPDGGCFKTFGMDTIFQEMDDDVFQSEPPRRKSLDFNVVLKSFSKNREKAKTRSVRKFSSMPKGNGQRRNTFHVPVSHNLEVKTSSTSCQACGKENSKKKHSLPLEISSDSLLCLLRNQKLVSDFREFLKTEYSDENLDFWLDCELYKNIAPQKRPKYARRIYETYIKCNAPKEVNLDGRTKALVRSDLFSPGNQVFSAAQGYIFKLMLNDSFRRYSSFCEECSN